VLPPRGGISFDRSGMNRIVANHARDGDAMLEVGVMRMLKTALDPHNLLNPGKILPER